ncbi:bifunctional pyr operon transcriptional regulator/uracil phosphoribosyltransferase PyrR [Alkalilimnicola ehrlichii MLHE-1]|uniref:Phosphoribosyltransferase n=1 Tax=Alkalilimnicola ehrlichii (strain ATCC BAA-1101 / DSM 17681 / MLHE-1) TaxID=187272 RepID=Q0ABT5_ALKEH|nr:bifunctional pyr operon transcriptional regulator/uracil phosphoribosyltransferase PyrR [Alkalilimnicola ehrlichii]ABI55702.1 phosphoribosyltransferase [Alkalilimnicola ehrlichii MLHE-1]
MTTPEVTPLLERVQHDLEGRLQALDAPLDEAAMVGIHTGGAWVARALHQRLGLALPLGTLDIAFYRDDVGQAGLNPQVRPSSLPFDVDDRVIVLVDDVLHTGRTVRAALNEIFDYGRPAAVLLVVLVDRGGRELPFAADVVGTRLSLPRHRRIKLSGPEPLHFIIQDTA